MDTSRLSTDIKKFCDQLAPSHLEENLRTHLAKHVVHLIAATLPGAKVEVYGSFKTKLYLPTSDIDVAVSGSWPSLPLRQLEQELYRTGLAEDHSVTVLDRASVPVVKMVDRISKIHVDISFNVSNISKQTAIIKTYLEKYPDAKLIFTVLKLYLAKLELNNAFHGGLASYGLLLMVIFYYQMSQQGQPHAAGSLGNSLLGFLDFYGTLDYRAYGITVLDGGKLIDKKTLDARQKMSHLYIENPVLPGKDVARCCYNLTLIKQAFQTARLTLIQEIYNRGADSEILSAIITIPEKVHKARDAVRSCMSTVLYRTGNQSPSQGLRVVMGPGHSRDHTYSVRHTAGKPLHFDSRSCVMPSQNNSPVLMAAHVPQSWIVPMSPYLKQPAQAAGTDQCMKYWIARSSGVPIQVHSSVTDPDLRKSYYVYTPPFRLVGGLVPRPPMS